MTLIRYLLWVSVFPAPEVKYSPAFLDLGSEQRSSRCPFHLDRLPRLGLSKARLDNVWRRHPFKAHQSCCLLPVRRSFPCRGRVRDELLSAYNHEVEVLQVGLVVKDGLGDYPAEEIPKRGRNVPVVLIADGFESLRLTVMGDSAVPG